MRDDLHNHDQLDIPPVPRGPWTAGRPEPATPDCPGCGAPLQMGPLGPTEPDRSVGVCPGRGCGEIVTFRRLEERLIVAERRRP